MSLVAPSLVGSELESAQRHSELNSERQQDVDVDSCKTIGFIAFSHDLNTLTGEGRTQPSPPDPLSQRGCIDKENPGLRA